MRLTECCACRADIWVGIPQLTERRAGFIQSRGRAGIVRASLYQCRFSTFALLKRNGVCCQRALNLLLRCRALWEEALLALQFCLIFLDNRVDLANRTFGLSDRRTCHLELRRHRSDVLLLCQKIVIGTVVFCTGPFQSCDKWTRINLE